MTGAAIAGAVALGLGFGFFLEQGGMGNARKLAGQFYLTDFAVLKIMFTAILTAMLGLFWLTRLGLVDPNLIYVPPTWFWPHLLGGVVFGVGFVMGGLCPGTSCVAASTGRLDGFALMGGMLIGILVFNEAFPLVAGFYDSTPMGTATLASVSGRSEGVAVFAVVLAALGAFRVARWIERRRAAPVAG